MCTLSRGERFKDARLVHNRNGKQTMDEVYTATGVSASMIKDLEDDEKNRSVGYDKIAILAKHYDVSSDYLLGLTNDPHRNPCATDELGLSAISVSHILNFLNYTSIGQDGIDGLNLLMEKGYLLELAYRIKIFCDHIAEDMEMSQHYNGDTSANLSDPKLQRVRDDFILIDKIKNSINKEFPDCNSRFRILTGYRFIAAEKREIVDDFEKMLCNVSNYDQFLSTLPNQGMWL